MEVPFFRILPVGNRKIECGVGFLRISWIEVRIPIEVFAGGNRHGNNDVFEGRFISVGSNLLNLNVLLIGGNDGGPRRKKRYGKAEQYRGGNQAFTHEITPPLRRFGRWHG